MHRTQAMLIDPTNLNNETARLLKEIIKHQNVPAKFNNNVLTQIVKYGGIQRNVSLNYPLYLWKKEIKELGLSKTKYEVQSLNYLGKGSYGAVYESLGSLKLSNGNLFFAKPKHERVLKHIGNLKHEYTDYAEGAPLTEALKKQIYQTHYHHFHKESHLMFHRAKYTHAKNMVLDDKAGYLTSKTILSRKIAGNTLEKQRENLSTQERLAAATLLIKNYILQIEDNKLIHYDIKPGNFIFEPRTSRGKYLDFGFAQKAENKKRVTCGSPLYLAYEIFLEKDTSKATDYFALGRSLQDLFGDANMVDITQGGPNHCFVTNSTASESTIMRQIESGYLNTMHRYFVLQSTINNHSAFLDEIKKYAALSFIYNFQNLTGLFENYNLKSELQASDQKKIKTIISSLIEWDPKKRPPTLYNILTELFLIQMSRKYKIDESAQEFNILISAVYSIIGTFHQLRCKTMDDISAIETNIIEGIDHLPINGNYKNDQNSPFIINLETNLLDMYFDFLELDYIDHHNVKEAKENIKSTFNLYRTKHKSLIEALKKICQLIEDRSNKNLPESHNLQELFFDTYSQLTRKDSCPCNFNEIADLAKSWKEKLPGIETRLNNYLIYYPLPEHCPMDIDVSPSTNNNNVLILNNKQIKSIKSGAKFLRTHCNDEVVSLLNKNRHYTALVLQNCFEPDSKNSIFFNERILPYFYLFDEIKMIIKKKTNNQLIIGNSFNFFLDNLKKYLIRLLLSESINEANKNVDQVKEVKLILNLINDSPIEFFRRIRELSATVNKDLANLMLNSFSLSRMRNNMGQTLTATPAQTKPGFPAKPGI